MKNIDKKWNDKEFVLAEISKDPMNLQYASLDLRNNK